MSTEEDQSGLEVERRLSWRFEAEKLQDRLDTIETIARTTHDTIVAHVAEERETKAAVEELILLWRGSKMLVSAFRLLIPALAVVTAIIAGSAGWIKDHVKW